MHYTFYKTTNLVNGRKYLGVMKSEQTRGRHKTYLGSGTALALAVDKYGADSFIREDLATGTQEEMYELEALAVDEQCVSSDWYYNIKPGGKGGFHQSAYDNRVKSRKGWKYPPLSDEHKEKLRKANLGKKASETAKNKMIKNNAKSIPVVVDGVQYSSYRQAALALNKDARTIKKHYGTLC